MSRIKIQQKHIEIHRNVIENFLLKVKDLMKKHRSAFRYGSLGLVLVVLIVVAVTIYFDSSEKSERTRYDQLMGRYYSAMARGDDESAKRTISEFNEFVASAHTDYIEDMGPYLVGNMYFSQKMYRDARIHLLKYAEDSPETELTSLALLKAAVASEEMNELDEAYRLFTKLERDHKDSLAAEQIYYHLAGYYLKRNNTDHAKKYYERVITSFPGSPFALLARERLMFLEAVR